jgi:hypothetical protein
MNDHRGKEDESILKTIISLTILMLYTEFLPDNFIIYQLDDDLLLLLPMCIIKNKSHIVLSGDYIYFAWFLKYRL